MIRNTHSTWLFPDQNHAPVAIRVAGERERGLQYGFSSAGLLYGGVGGNNFSRSTYLHNRKYVDEIQSLYLMRLQAMRAFHSRQDGYNFLSQGTGKKVKDDRA